MKAPPGLDGGGSPEGPGDQEAVGPISVTVRSGQTPSALSTKAAFQQRVR